MNTRITLSAVAAATALFFASEAGAQSKSNIKDDPNSSACTTSCEDAGYEWAVANTPAQESDCAAANTNFADGCKHWLEEQVEAAAPPPEEPMATDAAGDSASSATQVDDSSAPPTDAPADPPSGQ